MLKFCVRYFAIKVLKQRGNRDQRVETEQEVQKIIGLSHKHVIRCFGVVDDGDYFGAVFEFANNGDLGRFIEVQKTSYQSWLQVEIADWFCQIVHGMAFLHGNAVQKLMHRDVKPANIVIHLLISGSKIAFLFLIF